MSKRKRKSKYSQADIDAVIELRDEGLSYKEIADQLPHINLNSMYGIYRLHKADYDERQASNLAGEDRTCAVQSHDCSNVTDDAQPKRHRRFSEAVVVEVTARLEQEIALRDENDPLFKLFQHCDNMLTLHRGDVDSAIASIAVKNRQNITNE